MVSNYPPGVTGNEIEIAGELHYKECPLNDDFEFSDYDAHRLDPYDVLALVQEVYYLHTRGFINRAEYKALRPFRWLLECCCDDIHRDRQSSL